LNASKGRKPAFDYDSLEEGAPHEADSSDEDNYQPVLNSPKKSALKSSTLKKAPSPRMKPNGTSVSFHISQQDQPPPIQENEEEELSDDGACVDN